MFCWFIYTLPFWNFRHRLVRYYWYKWCVSLHVCKVCRHHLFAWRRSLLPYQGCNLLCTRFADFILPHTSIMRISRWLHAKHCKLLAHPTDNLGAHLDRNMPQAKNCGSTVVSAVSTAESLAAKTRKRCRNQRQRLPRILLKAKPSLLIHAVRRTTRPLGETDEAMVKRSKEVHSRKLTWQWKITIFKIGVTSSNGPYSIAIFVFGRIIFSQPWYAPTLWHHDLAPGPVEKHNKQVNLINLMVT